MQIVDDIHHTSEQFAKLSDSPELTNGLSNLDRSMANIAQVTGQSASGLGRSWPRNLGTRSESSQRQRRPRQRVCNKSWRINGMNLPSCRLDQGSKSLSFQPIRWAGRTTRYAAFEAATLFGSSLAQHPGLLAPAAEGPNPMPKFESSRRFPCSRLASRMHPEPRLPVNLGVKRTGPLC